MLRPFALVTPSTRGPSVAMTGRPPVKTESPVYATYRQGHPEKINRAPSSFGRSQPRLMMIHLDLEDERTIRSAANNLGEILPPQPGNYAKNLQGQHLLSPPPLRSISPLEWVLSETTGKADGTPTALPKPR